MGSLNNLSSSRIFVVISSLLHLFTFVSCLVFRDFCQRVGSLNNNNIIILNNSLKKNEKHSIGLSLLQGAQRASLHRTLSMVDNNHKITTLTDLTKQLDTLLQEKGDKTLERTPTFHQDPDSCIFDGTTTAEYEVLVILGKALKRDQVTVEYAARIREAVNILKKDCKPPDMICFTGGISPGNLIPDASLGLSYFKKMCEAQQVNLEGIEFYVDLESDSEKEALRSIIEHITDIEEIQGEGLHFTFISQEYHLAQLNEISAISQGQSMLKLISDAGASHSFSSASYPFIFSQEETIVFKTETYLLVEELVSLTEHLRGVGNGLTFFQVEQYNRLLDIRRQLNDQVAILHTSDTPPSLLTTEKALRMKKMLPLDSISSFKNIQDNSILIDESLEAALATLSEVSDILRPVVNLEGSVSLAQYKCTAEQLESAINCMRKNCDPDRPLTLREWMAIVSGGKDYDEQTQRQKKPPPASTVQTPKELLGLLQRLKSEK